MSGVRTKIGLVMKSVLTDAVPPLNPARNFSE
jgi:hypothetical protein